MARRVRPLVACAVLAVALHVAFLDGVGWTVRPTGAASAPLSVRTIAPGPAAAVLELPPPVDTAEVEGPRLAPSPRPSVMVDRSPPPHPPKLLGEGEEASAGSRSIEVVASTTSSTLSIVEAAATGIAIAASTAATGASSQATPEGLATTIPGAGDRPPPVYPTRLPPAARIHYQVRRGFLHGDGEIRWQPSGDSYRLSLEASVAGLTLLVQTSEGAIDGNGLAPVRFLDQRARRAAQAANFVRESGRITFSGTTVEWPLFAGSQDRLSWMIQLAGIVAADPALLREGARITMVVVGARGDADVWSLRYLGREAVETANGSVIAERLLREGHSANDTTAEVWLDPQRAYLPAHATLRNASGAPEYELLLDRIEP